mgnify:CR=1 FL=1
MDKSPKIAHLTSAHDRYDTRIFLKMCASLASHDYSVFLVVADGLKDEVKAGVQIIDIGAKAGGRISRMTRTVGMVYRKAKEINAEVYHLHDPELILIGILLKRLGKIVIFDSHEDLPKQILSKPYLSGYSKRVLSTACSIFEKWACLRLDAVVGATPYIRDKFKGMGVNAIDVNNYPILAESQCKEVEWGLKENQVVYVGGLERVRGVAEMVQALELTKSAVKLQLGGIFSESEFRLKVQAESGWKNVEELGWLDREGVYQALSQSVGGLVTLQPIANYLDSLPVKMFEYMSVGIPVISSNFPLWKSIVEGNDCGVCVDPLNPKEIASAIDYLVANPGKAEEMGRRGRVAVQTKYNWALEECKLFNLYKELLIKN